MKHKKETMVIVGIVAFLIFLVFVAVVASVAIYTHREAGLEEGTSLFDPSDFPLGVSLDGPMTDNDETAAVAAIVAVDARLGFLTTTFLTHKPLIRLHLGHVFTTGNRGNLGRAVKSTEGNRTVACDVYVGNVATINQLHWTVYHEIGHCLGLAHDNYRDSIMYPVSPSDDFAGYFGFSDSDRRLLRGLYSPRRRAVRR